MGNLVINTNKISTNVIPNIKNADTYIKNAKTYATSMYGLLPKDFSSRSTALNIKTEIEYLSSDIEKLLSFFQSKASSIDEIDFKNSNRLHSFVDTVNNIQNRNNSFMSINGIYYTEEGLSKELENIMSDDVFKSEVILAICINEQNKNEINKGTVSGFHQLESTQNNFYFTSTEEANKVYNENLKDFIALYNNKWKQGIVPQNEFLNGVKKFFDCQDAYVKYLEFDTYYQEQIDTLKKENDNYNKKIKKLNEQYRGSTDYSYLSKVEDPDTAAIGRKRIDEYFSKVKPLEAKVTENSDLIAYYTEQLAYSNVEKLYNAERVNVINTKEYNNLSIEDAKAELEEFSICYPDDTNASANDAVAGRCEKVEDIISLGTEEDIKLVCLYSRNHTEKETKKFISAAVSPRINKVFAEQQAKLYESKGSIGRFAQGTGTAIHSGCEGIGNAITGIAKMITSDDSYTFAGKNTIALGEIQNIEKCKALNYWYSGVQSAVAQSPGVALSFVPYVGKGLALGYSAAYSAGNTYVEDVNAGKDAKTARSVAIINAGVELASSALLGAIPVEGALTKSAKSALATTGNRFVRKFMNYAIDTGGEILEEEIQNGLTLGIKNIAYGEHNTYSIESATDTACVTGISTFLLRGGSSAFRRIYNTNINTSNELNLQNNLVTADNIVNNNNNFMFNQPNIDNSVNSVIDNVRNTTNPIPNNTLTNDVHSKVALRLNNLPKSLMGFALFGVPYTKNRFIYKNTNNIDGLNNNIKNNCLYHFTSEGNIDLILDSGYVKASNRSTSYGNEKSFFFNGIPEVGNYALNLDTVPLTATAVKIVPTDVALNSDSMKVRIGDDGAITWDGNFNFKDNVASAEKVYLALSKENGKYFYKEVSEDVYRNYNDNHPTNVDIFAKGNNKDIATSFAGNFLYDVYSKKVSNSVNKIKGTLSNRVNNLFIHNNAFNVVEHSVLDESSKFENLNNNVVGNNNNPLYPELFNSETSMNINNIDNQTQIPFLVDLEYKINLLSQMNYDNDNSSPFGELYKEIFNNIKSKFEESNGIIANNQELQSALKIAKSADVDTLILSEILLSSSTGNIKRFLLSCDDKTLKGLCSSPKVKYNFLLTLKKLRGQFSFDVYTYLLQKNILDQSDFDSLSIHFKIQMIKNANLDDSFFETCKNNGNYGVNQGFFHRWYQIKSHSWIKNFNSLKQFLIDVKSKGLNKNSPTYAEELGKIYQWADNKANLLQRSTFVLESDYRLILQYIAKNGNIIQQMKNRSLIKPYSYENPIEFNRLIEKMKALGYSETAATLFLKSIDTTGVCSYAAECNMIFSQFKNNPQLFKNTFGYDMYININGEKVLNAGELLLDFYFTMNMSANPHNSNLKSFANNTAKQKYMSRYIDGVDQNLINAFLHSKNANLTYTKEICFSNSDNYSIKEIHDTVVTKLGQGRSVEFGFYADPNGINNFTLIAPDGANYGDVCTTSWEEGDGHAVFVTGITNDSFIVSSWGQKYYIKFSDFIKGQYTFSIGVLTFNNNPIMDPNN